MMDHTNSAALTKEQFERVKTTVRFQWPDILQALGGLNDDQVSVKKGKSGTPCPLCGGDDRYSFKDEEKGGWACRKCGGGDGWTLLMDLNNWDFTAAVEHAGRYLGVVDGSASVDLSSVRREQEAKRKAKSEREAQSLEQAIRKECLIWEQAGKVKIHPWIAHKRLSDTALAQCRQVGHKLLIPVFSPEGKRISHQCVTEIGEGEFRKSYQKGIPTKGGLIEFGPESPCVFVAESFADADAVFQLAGQNHKTICAFSGGGIPAVVEYACNKYPESLIVVCPDNDEVGQKSVEKVAHILPAIAVSYPPFGKDWSEYFLDGGEESPMKNKNNINVAASKVAENKVVSLPKLRPKEIILLGKELMDEELARLEDMNRRFCHTVVGGKHVIASSKYCSAAGETTAFEPLEQFKNYFLHCPQIADTNAGAFWLKWSGKHHKLGGVTFQPCAEKCPKDIFNLWHGFKVESIEGDCSLYLDHLRKVICGGDESAYSYLVGWLAHMVQKLDEKPSVAIFMRSVMGAGKDTMVRALSEMLGRHALTLNGDEQITGRFQGALQEKLFVYINEARILDSRTMDRMKSLISEKEVSLELKGKDPVRIPNFARFILASNHEHVIRADPRERRYLMLEPKPLFEVNSPEHFAYFKSLHAWIDNGGAQYLLQYLQSLDLTNFNPHSAPTTAMLIEQKQHSMQNSHQFIREWLNGCDPIEWPKRIPARDLTDNYRSWHEANIGEKLTATKAGREVGAVMKKLTITPKQSNGKYYPLPDLESMKAKFAKLYQTTIDKMF